MKNFFKLLVFVLIVTISLPFAASPAKAAANTANRIIYDDIAQTNIIYDDNGGYFVETLENTNHSLNTSTFPISVNSNTVTKSKTKTVSYYNSNNVFCWSYSLTATFNIKLGSSVTYKSSKASLDKMNSWSVVSESHSGSGTKASGTIKMKKNGTTISRTVTIQCDKNGNFS